MAKYQGSRGLNWKLVILFFMIWLKRSMFFGLVHIHFSGLTVKWMAATFLFSFRLFSNALIMPFVMCYLILIWWEMTHGASNETQIRTEMCCEGLSQKSSRYHCSHILDCVCTCMSQLVHANSHWLNIWQGRVSHFQCIDFRRPDRWSEFLSCKMVTGSFKCTNTHTSRLYNKNGGI